MPRMTQAHFSLVYDGDALREGEIDVTELAPALLALAQAVKATGKIVLGPDADVNLKVRTMKTGSFEVLLNAVAAGDVGLFWSMVKAFYATEDVQTAKAVIETLFLVGSGVGAASGGAYAGVVGFLKWKRNRAITRREDHADGSVTVEIDGDKLTLAPGAFVAAQDPTVRSAIEKAIAEPLDRDGIDEVRVGAADGKPQLRISKDERDYLRAATGANDEFSSTYVKAFTIVTLSFKSENKWKLHDGQAPRSVTISDEAFIAGIDSGAIRFAKGDLLVCQVRETARRTGTGLKSQYEVLKVIEHRPYLPPDTLQL